jgi:hypothetical protein
VVSRQRASRPVISVMAISRQLAAFCAEVVAMRRSNLWLTATTIITVVVIAAAVLRTETAGQSEKDPHRPPCMNARCREIKAFLKAHYCGESPFGNGPDDGCDIKGTKKPHVDVVADFRCAWNEAKAQSECRQYGQPSPADRNTILGQLHRLGLPIGDDKAVLFVVWKHPSGLSVAKGSYGRIVGTNLRLCEVILVIDQHSGVSVLRKVPFQTTDADVPAVITWSVIDVVDADGDGSPDIVLQGDAYEDHWLEVVSQRGALWKTIFSGLGYYL